MSLKATLSAIWLIHQFLLRVRPRLLIEPYLTNSLCPASLPGPKCLPCWISEAKPLQQAATWEHSSLPELSIGKTLPGLVGLSSTCLESHPDMEVTTRHPFLPCPLCSALGWSEDSVHPILRSERATFSNFHLAACLQE